MGEEKQLSSSIRARSKARNAAPVFTTTHWSVVMAARGDSPEAREAIGKLCQTYWRPVYSYLRHCGFQAEDAEDLTQGFFAMLLERRDFERIKKEKGRLRSYLLASLKHFITNQKSRAFAIKRGEGHQVFPLDILRDSEEFDSKRSDILSADQVYERRWAIALLNQVLARLEAEYRTAGKGPLFERLQKWIMQEPDAASQRQIAREFGMKENAIHQVFHRFRQRYRELLREEVSQTVMAPLDIEEELRHLVAVLRS
ncbi:MAG: sigma-70 family RNA polymerase sigma factor [Chthoniobacterales bacterium]|nr:sigma-70 family RNA polymerase sigma factor [Chthoniobacterales bacterium]